MTTETASRRRYISLDERTQRDPTSVRAAIYNRSSDPGAKPEDVIEQRLQCEEFIARMGWPKVPEHRIFMDAKSGMRNVQRPSLDEVHKLCARGEIHVVVSREMERVARDPEIRGTAIGKAKELGVEWRFANRPPDGKPPEGEQGLVEQFLINVKAKGEAEKIVERLTAPKLRRYEQGLPHGGRTLLYGYAPGERAMGKGGRPKGLLTWLVDEEKAYWVHWMFDYVDQMDPHDFSQRTLARELDRRAPTATGTGRWSAKQVTNLLTNPKYCGQGRSLRWKTGHEKTQDLHTFITSETSLPTQDRLRDKAAWRALPPIPETSIPRIIEPDQFERVQVKLTEAAALKNRGGSRRTDSEVPATLLDQGYALCAYVNPDGRVCGGNMTRYWHAHSQRVQYQHNPRAGSPTHPHKTNQIPAREVDSLALRLLARALADPEKLIELADAAEAQHAAAVTETALAEASLAVCAKKIAEIADEQHKLSIALTALSAVPGMEAQIAGIRDRQAQLAEDERQAKQTRSETVPQRDHARERQDLLAKLTTYRDFTISEETNEFSNTGDPSLQPNIDVESAAELLGVTAKQLSKSKLGRLIYDIGYFGEPEREPEHVMDTPIVVELLLRRAPRERVRKLLRDLDAVITVKPPRSRAEWAEHGRTPIADRVELVVLGSVSVRTDVANVSRFS